MDILIRIFKPAPKNDQLWDMLRENCVHLALDNQDLMMPQKGDDGYRRERAYEASHKHSLFCLATDESIKTVNVLTQARTQKGRDAQAKALQDVRSRNYRCVDWDNRNLRATFNPTGSHWIDSCNPWAEQQFVTFKTHNSALSYENLYRQNLVEFLEREESDTELISGCFAEICVPQTAHDVADLGHRVIVDPDQIYSAEDFSTPSLGDIALLQPFFATITEPGQVEYVLKKYAPK
jgi:nicotinamidase-related amidase